MIDMQKPSRRGVLKLGAAAVSTGIAGPFFPGRVLGANDRVNVAVIGVRGQGGVHIDEYMKLGKVRLKTLCDVDENLFGERLKAIAGRSSETPGTTPDMRRVFDDKDIDAVSIATPNVWHALAAIWAAQAGKHVYVEKPASHTLWEGRQMVHAARKHKVLMQVGFQNRSRRNTRAAIELLRSGKLGKVFMARGLCFKPRGDIGQYADGPMSDGSQYRLTVGGKPLPPYTRSYLSRVQYDLWTGPAPLRPFNPNRFHYNWHWNWDYGNGDTGNQGPHQFDVGRWGLGKDEYPVKIRSSGGMYLYKNQQQTPNVQTTILEYADGTLFEFATRGVLTNTEGKLAGKEGRSGLTIGNVFYGSEGRLEIDASGNWQTYFGPKDEAGPSSAGIREEASDATVTTGQGLGGHFANFVEAVRAGKASLLNCDIEVGLRSSALPLLANIAYRVGRDLTFDGAKERFVGEAQANGMLRRADRKGFQVPELGPLGSGGRS